MDARPQMKVSSGSEAWSQTNSIRISWGLTRFANSRVTPQKKKLRICQSVFIKLSARQTPEFETRRTRESEGGPTWGVVGYHLEPWWGLTRLLHRGAGEPGISMQEVLRGDSEVESWGLLTSYTSILLTLPGASRLTDGDHLPASTPRRCHCRERLGESE